MIITHKIQCFPNQTQKSIINQTLGACRWIYNQYLALNIERHRAGKSFVSAYDYGKKITVLKKEDPTYMWLSNISQKAIKQSIITCENTYKRFFKNKKGFPKFKSKKRNPVTSYYMYPVKGKYKHNKIKLPLLGWMRICENSYVIHSHIVNARMIRTKQDKYFIQLSTDVPGIEYEVGSPGIGIDVGIKSFASIARADGKVSQIPSFIQDSRIRKYENRIMKLQRIISNKAEMNYGKLLNNYLDSHHGDEPSEEYKNIMKGVSYSSSNIQKVRRKIVALNKKISDYKTNKLCHIVNALVKAKPEFVAIEDLSVSNMISKSNPTHVSTLSKFISSSRFYEFRTRLMNKCLYYNIPIHLANKYFASSKICCNCGHKKKSLLLSDRIYTCEECGTTMDRDLNAAINLVNMKKKQYSLI